MYDVRIYTVLAASAIELETRDTTPVSWFFYWWVWSNLKGSLSTYIHPSIQPCHGVMLAYQFSTRYSSPKKT